MHIFLPAACQISEWLRPNWLLIDLSTVLSGIATDTSYQNRTSKYTEKCDNARTGLVQRCGWLFGHTGHEKVFIPCAAGGFIGPGLREAS
jgi:hypothetical protein